MADFYSAIKVWFDADEAIEAAGFSELFMGQAPPTEDEPYCVLVPAEESRVHGGFGSNEYEEAFTLHVIDKTQELVRSHAAIIEARFKDKESSIAFDGATLLYLEKQTRRYEQVAEDTWDAQIQYVTRYEVLR